MRGSLELHNPHISAYLIGEALSNYEKTLGRSNQCNKKVIAQQLKWGREYVLKHKNKLIPQGVFVYNKTPHFRLKEVLPQSVLCEFTYFLSIPDEESALPSNEQTELLVSFIKTAFMDSTRRYISSIMLPALYHNEVQGTLAYVSPCLGPGLFSMPMEEMKVFFDYLQVPQQLATLSGSICLPVTSFAGVVYGLKEPWKGAPCNACESHSNCQLCMIQHYKET